MVPHYGPTPLRIEHNIIVGGPGIYTAVFFHNYADYQFGVLGAGPGGTTPTVDITGLHNSPFGDNSDFTQQDVEIAEFADQSFFIATGQHTPFINMTTVTCDGFVWSDGSGVGPSDSIALTNLVIFRAGLVDGTHLSDYAATNGIDIGRSPSQIRLLKEGVRTFALLGLDAAFFIIDP